MTLTDWEQGTLLEDDAVTVTVRLSYLHGWEWSLRYRDGHGWALLEAGLAKTAPDALARASEALLDVAHGWEF